MRFQLAIFSKELILFSATLILGLWAAYQYLGVSESSLFVQASGFHLYDLWSLAIVVLILLLAMKFRSVGRFFFRAFLLLLVFAGGVFISGLLFNWHKHYADPRYRTVGRSLFLRYYRGIQNQAHDTNGSRHD